MKHNRLVSRQPKVALELSIMYAEGVVFSVLFFLLPFISLKFYMYFLLSYLALASIFAALAAWKEKRFGLLFVPIPYTILVFINSYVFLEQMVSVMILRRRNLSWFHPERFAPHTNSHNS